MRIAIIGAGAAGCFCSVNLSRLLPKAVIDVFEAGKTPLAKVALTGGGRCNLTNSFEAIKSISEAYPRGTNLMKRLLKEFGWKDTCEWFEKEGVRLVIQPDNCVFPKSQDAMQIVRVLLYQMKKQGVNIFTSAKVTSIEELAEGGFRIRYGQDGSECGQTYDKVIVTTGGSPKRHGLSFLDPLGLEIIEPIPSLFTFNLPEQSVTSLSGTVVQNASVSLPGQKVKSSGPLLITDWGMSGPAILKLSSYHARALHDLQYETDMNVNWLPDLSENGIRQTLESFSRGNQKKNISSTHFEQLTSRLWEHILSKASLRPDIKWSEIGSKGISRLTSTLMCDTYHIKGRGKFKEEFVTCGGVSLSNINPATLECKTHPGLFLAGEVLDVDAITGGFNLQAAWTMGMTIARNLARQTCTD